MVGDNNDVAGAKNNVFGDQNVVIKGDANIVDGLQNSIKNGN
jgi:hypothetical protein